MPSGECRAAFSLQAAQASSVVFEPALTLTHTGVVSLAG